MKKKKISAAAKPAPSIPPGNPVELSSSAATATAVLPPSRFSPTQVAIGLALLTFLVYFRAICNGWTNFDDNVYVTENPDTLRGLTWENIVWAFSTWHAAFWQPLVWLSYQAEVSLFGTNPHFYHFTNVFWHVLDTVLLFFLIRTLTGTLWRSAFVAALFALHPLHVESVAWITERKDVLSAGFFFASILTYALYARAKKGERTGLYLGTLGLFVLGLMAKPMLVTFPLVLLLLDFWPLKRLSLASFLLAVATIVVPALGIGIAVTFPLDAGGILGLPLIPLGLAIPFFNRSVRRPLLDKVPFILLATVAAFVAVHAVADYNDLRPLSAYPLDMRIKNSIESYCAYLGNLFWPSDLIAFYIYPTVFPLYVVLPEALLLIGITVVAFREALRERRPWLLAGWFWFLGTLVPVIGIVKTGSFARADRYTYIPLVGLFIIVAWGLAEIAGSDARRRKIAAWAASAIVALLSLLTFVQIGQWEGTIPLFTRMIAIGGTENALAQYNLGLGYYDAQKQEPNPEKARLLLQQAEGRFREAFRIRPDYCQAHNNLGIVLMLLGRNDESFQNFEIAARLDPTHVPALDNFGHGLVERGRYAEAIAVLSRALALAPNDTRAHFSIGDAYALSNRPAEAIPHLAYFLAVNPGNLEARRKLGLLYSQTGNAAGAAEQFGIVVSQNPGDALMRNNYGFLLLRAGQTAEAEAQIREAIRLQSAMPEAHNNLGIVLNAQGRKAEAAVEFREAIRLRPDYADAKENLARATK
ncbi:Tfp pilus assembly protein PilF [Verrucomicrobium sp. GAS474]|uniref:tetratricopeptide repeat protein n=1 Tax=Verrucomicrobium sp. GAS474 TaxID=1882831 RepID=UPI00087AFAA4|nr:tetratricopeptide repeat protein [Verrucomicrobium sp. GAS474]SDT96954.1 Tfp pilus assembly protein PilF [Verrucomicrobium sp. GAS474]